MSCLWQCWLGRLLFGLQIGLYRIIWLRSPLNEFRAEGGGRHRSKTFRPSVPSRCLGARYRESTVLTALAAVLVQLQSGVICCDRTMARHRIGGRRAIATGHPRFGSPSCLMARTPASSRLASACSAVFSSGTVRAALPVVVSLCHGVPTTGLMLRLPRSFTVLSLSARVLPRWETSCLHGGCRGAGSVRHSPVARAHDERFGAVYRVEGLSGGAANQHLRFHARRTDLFAGDRAVSTR